MTDTEPATAEETFAALGALGKDTAPRKTSDRARASEGEKKGDKSESSTRRTTTRTPPLEKRLSQTFTMIAVTVSAFDPVCGGAVAERAQDLAGAWNRLAQQDPRVKKALESLMSGGAYGEALFMTGLTLLPILRHHGLLPENLSEVFQTANGFEDDVPQGAQDIPPSMDEQRQFIQ